MLALIRKDLYVIRGTIILYTVMGMAVAGMLAWIPEKHYSLSTIIPLLTANQVMYTIDGDERWRWDRFAAISPLRPWQIVLAKYLLAYGLLAWIIGAEWLAGWASSLGKGGTLEWWGAVVVLLELATWLPLRYRFDRGKAVAGLILIWGVFAALLLNPWGLMIADVLFGWMDGIPRSVLALGAAAVLVGLSAGSVFLAIRFYTRRQRGWYD